MIVIVGLGNRGEEYKDTRHNAGRVVLDFILKEWGMPSLVKSSRHDSLVSEGVIGGQEITVCFPNSYMNESGKTVRRLVEKDAYDRLVVVYDDVDLPFGEFKIAFGRGDGGHNGLASVIKELGSKDFIRIRIGIAPRSFFGNILRPEGEKLAAYVLGLLTKRERAKLEALAPSVKEALEVIIKDGKDVAMNRFN